VTLAYRPDIIRVEAQPAFRDSDLRSFRGGALAQQRVGVVGVRKDEEKVEADGRRGECHGDRREDDEQ